MTGNIHWNLFILNTRNSTELHITKDRISSQSLGCISIKNGFRVSSRDTAMKDLFSFTITAKWVPCLNLMSVFVCIYKLQTLEQFCTAYFAAGFRFTQAVAPRLLDPSGWSCTWAAAELCMEPPHQQRAALYTQWGVAVQPDSCPPSKTKAENEVLKLMIIQKARDLRQQLKGLFIYLFMYFKLIR